VDPHWICWNADPEFPDADLGPEPNPYQIQGFDEQNWKKFNWKISA
jgi:hypothetical protein